MTAFTVIIPARYNATRLPGKPLLALAGQPVIQHVWAKAAESGAEQVIIATDHPQIADTARGFGAQVCLTRADHASGTDRIAEVVEHYGLADEAIVVNLQGDEPFMPAPLIAQVAASLEQTPEAAIATLATPIDDPDAVHDPHTVKVVRTHTGRALYFSRAPIPWQRQGLTPGGQPQALRHLGLYAYRAGFLKRYASLPASALEAAEQLEQLRALEAGEWIQVSLTETRLGPGIDTQADLIAAQAYWLDIQN